MFRLKQNRTAMNVKILVFVIYVEVIIYLLLYILHECTLKTYKVLLFDKILLCVNF